MPLAPKRPHPFALTLIAAALLAACTTPGAPPQTADASGGAPVAKGEAQVASPAEMQPPPAAPIAPPPRSPMADAAAQAPVAATAAREQRRQESVHAQSKLMAAPDREPAPAASGTRAAAQWTVPGRGGRPRAE